MANPRSHDPCAERGRLKDIEETSSGLPADAEKLYSALTDIQSNIFPQDLQVSGPYRSFGSLTNPVLGLYVRDTVPLTKFRPSHLRGFLSSEEKSYPSDALSILKKRMDFILQEAEWYSKSHTIRKHRVETGFSWTVADLVMLPYPQTFRPLNVYASLLPVVQIVC